MEEKTLIRNSMKAVGVDGCRGGWLVATVEGRGRIAVEVYPDIAALLATHSEAKRILIDIPIGLPADAPRDCDTLARRLLGARAASVFPVPTRAAVHAKSYRQACDVNQRQLGRRLSKQTWNICSKIAEVDDWLQRNRCGGWLREAHPEVCFWALAGGKPMMHSKKTAAGVAERLAVLRPWLVKSGIDPERWREAGAGQDDLLDALALAVTAALPDERLRTLPETLQRDERGLAMEIVYGEVFLAERP